MRRWPSTPPGSRPNGSASVPPWNRRAGRLAGWGEWRGVRPARWEGAEFAVLDPYWDAWARESEVIARLTAEAERWPLIWSAGGVRVHRRPRPLRPLRSSEADARLLAGPPGLAPGGPPGAGPDRPGPAPPGVHRRHLRPARRGRPPGRAGPLRGGGVEPPLDLPHPAPPQQRLLAPWPGPLRGRRGLPPAGRAAPLAPGPGPARPGLRSAGGRDVRAGPAPLGAPLDPGGGSPRSVPSPHRQRRTWRRESSWAAGPTSPTGSPPTPLPPSPSPPGAPSGWPSRPTSALAPGDATARGARARLGCCLFGAGALAGLAQWVRADGLLFLVAPLLAALSGPAESGWAGRARRALPGVALVLAGAALTAGPLTLRAVLTWGTPAPPGMGGALWLTAYDDLFRFGQAPTFGRWLATGPAPAASVRGAALLTNLAALGQSLLYVALPLAALGAWRRRRKAAVALAPGGAAHAVRRALPGVPLPGRARGPLSRPGRAGALAGPLDGLGPAPGRLLGGGAPGVAGVRGAAPSWVAPWPRCSSWGASPSRSTCAGAGSPTSRPTARRGPGWTPMPRRGPA